MKKTIFAASILILAISISQACKKDPPAVRNTSGNIGYGLYMWSKQAPLTQKFTLNAGLGGWITGAKGCSFYFPANSLLDAGGNPVSGTVDIELREYMSKGDMLFSGVTPVSGDRILESGGMFYLMAKKSGAELKMKNGAGFKMIIPQSNNNNDPMDFWNGKVIVDSMNKVDWQKQDSVLVAAEQDSLNQKLNYFTQFDYFQFGFCNIDRDFYKFKTLITKFRIKMPAGCNDTNSTALLLFKNYNSCAWCHWIVNEELLATNYNLPLGETAKVVAYKKTGPGNDDLEYVLQEFTFTDNTLVTIGTMSKCTYDQLSAVIKAL